MILSAFVGFEWPVPMGLFWNPTYQRKKLRGDLKENDYTTKPQLMLSHCIHQDTPVGPYVCVSVGLSVCS